MPYAKPLDFDTDELDGLIHAVEIAISAPRESYGQTDSDIKRYKTLKRKMTRERERRNRALESLADLQRRAAEQREQAPSNTGDSDAPSEPMNW